MSKFEVTLEDGYTQDDLAEILFEWFANSGVDASFRVKTIKEED
jgi:hypothetical protein